ncbi:MAG: zinc ribbon domain-containing protein [Actinomycetota bacterium]|nr:zinc ribbon domain-containing protein [Actinomycetota bacterium]
MSSDQNDRGGSRIPPAGDAAPSVGRGLRRAFGHSADRAHVVDAEGAAIRDAARRVLAGETLSSIVAEWNRRGLPTASGGPWRVNSLSSLLLQPRLAGLRRDGVPFPAGICPPILDPDTHAQLIALHGTRRKAKRRATRHYLLTGLLRCWRCGGSLRGMPRLRGADLYVCPGPPHGGCSGTAITADHADDAVRELVFAHLDSPDFVARAARGYQRQSAGPASLALVRKLAKLDERLVGIGDRWGRGEISREVWLSQRQPLAEAAAETRVELERLSRLDAAHRLANTGATLRARWPAMTVKEQRDILRAVLDHVVVGAAEPPRQVFRAERLRPVWFR